MNIENARTATPRLDTSIDHVVCYADTDAGGYVYHARYIEWAERARNQLMYMSGYSFRDLASRHNVMLIVRKVEARHHLPAVLEDRLTMRSHIAWYRASCSLWMTEVSRGPDRLANIAIEMVALNVATRQIARHPAPFLDALMQYVGPAETA